MILCVMNFKYTHNIDRLLFMLEKYNRERVLSSTSKTFSRLMIFHYLRVVISRLSRWNGSYVFYLVTMPMMLSRYTNENKHWGVSFIACEKMNKNDSCVQQRTESPAHHITAFVSKNKNDTMICTDFKMYSVWILRT